MPVNSVHPNYAKASGLWSKCRDVVEGEEAVKARGMDYLPMLSKQPPEDYRAYKTRACFFSATGRTVDGLTGAVLRKDPDLEFPEGARKELEEVGLGKEPLSTLIHSALRESLITGRVGILVDAPSGEANAPAYLALYPAESIINWAETTLRGRKVIQYVVLKEEPELPDPKDPFKHEVIEQYRVLRLGIQAAIRQDDEGRPAGLNPGFTREDLREPFYYQEVWVKNEAAQKGAEDEFLLQGRIVPRTFGGRLLRTIPFVIANAEGSLGLNVGQPPLLDLANVNLSHYRTSADLEHGRHFTALPTPWAAGFDVKGEELKIGPSTTWIAEEPQAKAGMLEFTGAGLGHLATALQEKERQMAVLGSRLIEGQKPGVEAAETVRLRTAGEQSVLSTIADVLSQAFTQALRWWWSWGRAEESTKAISIQLNKDFNILGIPAPVLVQMMSMLQGGLISWQTWIYNLQRGEILPDGVSAEEEAELIAAGLPSGAGVLLGGPAAGTPEDEDEPEDDEDEDDEE